MIAQIQGLKYFVANQLSDVVDWPKHVRVDEKKTTGDHAFVDIATPFNRYKMAICSSYIEPPPGAPLACKSLGTVTFDDAAGNKRIVGPKADLTWTDISKHIHVRELTDALAAARRELAEGTGTNAKLAEVAERAKKWGVAAKVPDGFTTPIAMIQESELIGSGLSQADIDIVLDGCKAPALVKQAEAPASRDAPWLGAPIFFITNPGEQIGGMQEIVGWCVKVYSHDRISVFMTPDHSEPSYRDNLPRRGSPAGNGRMHQFNCWDFNPEALRQKQTMDEMFLSITHLVDRIETLEKEKTDTLDVLETIKNPGNDCRRDLTKLEYAMGDLQARVAALDDPLGPPKRRGRPPKVDDDARIAAGAEKAEATRQALNEATGGDITVRNVELDRAPEKPEGSEAA